MENNLQQKTTHSDTKRRTCYDILSNHHFNLFLFDSRLSKTQLHSTVRHTQLHIIRCYQYSWIPLLRVCVMVFIDNVSPKAVRERATESLQALLDRNITVIWRNSVPVNGVGTLIVFSTLESGKPASTGTRWSQFTREGERFPNDKPLGLDSAQFLYRLHGLHIIQWTVSKHWKARLQADTTQEVQTPTYSQQLIWQNSNILRQCTITASKRSSRRTAD